MSWLITKYLVTAAVVVVVSEAAKLSDKLGGFIAALPLVTVLTLIWLHIEDQPPAKVANTLGIRSGTCCRLCRCSSYSRPCCPKWASGPRC